MSSSVKVFCASEKGQSMIMTATFDWLKKVYSASMQKSRTVLVNAMVGSFFINSGRDIA